MNWLYSVLIFSLSTQLSQASPCRPIVQNPNSCPVNRKPTDELSRYISEIDPEVKSLRFNLDNKTINEQFEVDSLKESESPVDARIQINPDKKYQEVWGFGATVNEACLSNVNRLAPTQKQELMKKLFSPADGAGFSYLRVPVGGNDFSDGDYTLADSPQNKPDRKLEYFNPERFEKLLDFVAEAKKYNPNLKVMITPWTQPVWMKDTGTLHGGQLKKKYYADYATYLGKVIEVAQKHGTQVNHMSILNEPLIPEAKTKWHYPQSYMSRKDQKIFITKYLKPILDKNPQAPQLLLHDHNWDNASNENSFVKNNNLKSLVAGVAYHCYGGEFEDMQKKLSQNKNLAGFNTECSGTQDANNHDQGAFEWWLKHQSIDAMRAGMSGSLAWNLCLDENGGPRNNGCKICRGVVTIDHSETPKIILNPEYFALAQTSKYVQPGARRIESTETKNKGLVNVAFENPDGSQVLVVRNTTGKTIRFSSVSKPCGYETIQEIAPHSAMSLRWK